MDKSCDFYQRLDSIGISVSNPKGRLSFVDIERTILIAAAKTSNDLRILGLLLSWIQVHGERVNIERLRKLAKKNPPPWLGLFAIYGLYCKQTRWKVLVRRPQTTLANGDLSANQTRASFKGEEEWSKDSGFLIPKGSESIDIKRILTPSQLAKINQHYFNKLVYGSNWRADIITAFEAGAKNPTQAAKMCNCSYEPAHRVYVDLIAAGKLDKMVS